MLQAWHAFTHCRHLQAKPAFIRCRLTLQAAASLLQASLQILQDFDPKAACSLQRVLQLGGLDLAALLQLEGCPQDMTAQAYVQQAVQKVCVEDVLWQSTSFAKVTIQKSAYPDSRCKGVSLARHLR